MNTKEKLALIRQSMKVSGIDAYIIPSADPHMNEYLPNHWKIMAWLTGFTGSAGTVVITQDFAGVWTDSRYFIQAENQLKNSGFELVRLVVPHTPEYIDWLAGNLERGNRIGFDGTIVAVSLARQIGAMAAKNHFGIAEDIDLVSDLWKDRPPLPCTPVYEHELTYAGLSSEAKIEKVRLILAKRTIKSLLITAPDEIAWLLNIRASDIPYNPVAIAYVLINDKEVRIFIHPDQMDTGFHNKLRSQGVKVYPYESVWEHLEMTKGTVWTDPGKTSLRIRNTLGKNAKVFEDLSPVAGEKAVKNPVEIDNIRKTMIYDGIALERFFFWLETHIGKEKITELSAAKKLESLRAEAPGFRGPSFATISAAGPHGAIIHYTPDDKTDTEISPEELYLLDSGGQYLSGTTDVTRTVITGIPTVRQKKDFTLVLKGMISLSKLRFPAGTKGYQMDILARKPLWEEGLNYGHGTGHGVGFFLNVHEGPQSISPAGAGKKAGAIVPGMVISNEPGLYRENEYGIRIENLILCIPAGASSFGSFYAFETLTCCHIEQKLIDPSLLTREEVNWLNTYHQKVYDLLSPGMVEHEKVWLRNKTAPILYPAENKTYSA